MLDAYPDSALLDLCRRLGEQRAEWQRLYSLTTKHLCNSEHAKPTLTTAADHEWHGV